MSLIKAAIVTESHPVDIPNFYALFRRFEELDFYVQSFDLLANDEQKNQDFYDVIIFYNLSMGTPDQAHSIRKYIERKLGNGQGIVLLHHAICCYPEWDIWGAISGLPKRAFKYHWEQTVRYDIANADHPITKAMSPFAMIDETYTMEEPGADNEILITCNHPNSLHAIAWTRTYKQSRVFCYESGHDQLAYRDPNFREILRRGILWAAKKF